MEKKSTRQTSKSKKLILMVPDVLLCLLSWAVIYFWFKGNLWFWGMLIAFLALLGVIVVSGLKKKRSGNSKWSSFIFVWSFLLCLVPAIYVIVTIFWAILEMLPN